MAQGGTPFCVGKWGIAKRNQTKQWLSAVKLYKYLGYIRANVPISSESLSFHIHNSS